MYSLINQDQIKFQLNRHEGYERTKNNCLSQASGLHSMQQSSKKVYPKVPLGRKRILSQHSS